MITYSQLLDRIISNRPLSHTLYWTATVIISIIYGFGYGEPLALSIILEKVSLPTQIAATYLFIYVQLPLLFRKKYFIFFISFLLSSYFFHITMHISNDLWFGKKIVSYHSNHTLSEILQSGEYYLTYAVDIYLVVFVTAGIKLIKDNLENKKQFEILEAEKAKKEYQYLHSRIKPDFLLNTLDLIENQSKSNNKLAAQSIADLSEVLDYSLYKSDKTEISLTAECRQMELLTKLLASHSNTITNIEVSRSNLSNTQMIKPMRLTKVLEYIITYIDQVNKNNKSIHLETTSIGKETLIDLQISGIVPDQISLSSLKYISDEKGILKNVTLNVFPTKEGSNLQIELT